MPENEYVCTPTDHNLKGMYFSNDSEPTVRKGSVYVEYSKEGIYDKAGGGTFADFGSSVNEYDPEGSQKARVKRKKRLITLGLVAIVLLFSFILFGVYHDVTDEQTGM
jgi:hypothetical protein